jgi:cell division protein FtsQ
MAENRRQWLLSASAALAVLALVVLGSGVLLARNGGSLLPFQWIDVSGPFARVSAEQIRAAVAPEVARGFFLTNLGSVRERVMALPWVASAEVRKHWPDALEVRVTERLVLGHVGDDRLVDVTGAIFLARGAGETRGLPLLDADPLRMPLLSEKFTSAQRDLEGLGRQIVGASLSPRGALEFRLNDGLTVQVGSHDQDLRWRRFIAGLPRLAQLDPRPIALADLRYTHGFAVRYAEPVLPDASTAPNLSALEP